MIAKLTMGAAILALTGCAASLAGDDAGGALPAACNADPVQDLVGQPATQALAADAMKRSGARTFRWLPEGAIVTLEFRADRLNIGLDGENRVARIHCG